MNSYVLPWQGQETCQFQQQAWQHVIWKIFMVKKCYQKRLLRDFKNDCYSCHWSLKKVPLVLFCDKYIYWYIYIYKSIYISHRDNPPCLQTVWQRFSKRKQLWGNGCAQSSLSSLFKMVLSQDFLRVAVGSAVCLVQVSFAQKFSNSIRFFCAKNYLFVKFIQTF
jgi:hypothetical protein